MSKTKIFKISSEMEMVGLTHIQDKLYRIMSDYYPKLYLQYDYNSMHTQLKKESNQCDFTYLTDFCNRKFQNIDR